MDSTARRHGQVSVSLFCDLVIISNKFIVKRQSFGPVARKVNLQQMFRITNHQLVTFVIDVERKVIGYRSVLQTMIRISITRHGLSVQLVFRDLS